MPSDTHPAVLAVHEASVALIDHPPQTISGSFWRRWLDSPNEAHLADRVRAFIVALDLLLDVPPTMLTRADLVAVGEDAERVVKRVEAAINEPAAASSGAAAALVPAVYVIRSRYEELYQRGATKLVDGQ